MKDRLIALLRPPHGEDVRRLTAFVLSAVALPRLPFWPTPLAFSELLLLPSEMFGWISLIIGIALLATGGELRLRFLGRGVAVLAFVLWITLTAAATSVTSIIINAIFAYAMFGELSSMRNGC